MLLGSRQVAGIPFVVHALCIGSPTTPATKVVSTVLPWWDAGPILLSPTTSKEWYKLFCFHHLRATSCSRWWRERRGHFSLTEGSTWQMGGRASSSTTYILWTSSSATPANMNSSTVFSRWGVGPTLPSSVKGGGKCSMIPRWDLGPALHNPLKLTWPQEEIQIRNFYLAFGGTRPSNDSGNSFILC